MDSYISSDNQTRADNQQGRLDPQWIAGFVDGEGCFSISIIKNVTTKMGYQVFPEFVITQGAKSLSVLEDVKTSFGCGSIYENRRHDNHKESLYRYCVRSIDDILDKIIPFFQTYQLQTAKQYDFNTFCEVVDMLKQKRHLNPDGFNQIRALAATMNRQKLRRN